jgi:autotransporter-associated beta strand protein
MPIVTPSRIFSLALLFVAMFVLVRTARADSQQLYLDALVDFERYAETIWHDAGAGEPPDSGYWGDGGSSGNGGIRGSCGVAVAYATLIKALPNDPSVSNRIDRVRKALNYAANSHVTGAYVTSDGNQWGWSSASSTDWQTPEWSGSMGLACILIQSNLPAQTIQDVQRVVASEADHRASIPPASGYVGDTKSEENAWQGNILALAAAWLSTNADAPTWLTAAKSYLVNTYTVANTNGDPLAAWISTVTVYPSYALENHGFYHPTYEMVAGMSSGDSLLMARLSNPSVAADLTQYAEHNVMNVWSNNLQYMVMETGELAYPSSVDWSLHDYEHNSYLTWMTTHFNDPIARYADSRLAQLVRYRQQVNGDGEFVGPALPNGFYREAVEARRTAIAWLHWAGADFPSGPTNAPPASVSHFPDVKILAQRSAAGFASVSYGPRIMGWIEPASASMPSNTFISTPMFGGIFGHGPLGNATAATLVSLVTNANGFAINLLVQNGANGSTRVYVTSTGESVGIVEVPLPANGVTGVTAGVFTNGIQNDPLTGNTRLIEWAGHSTNVTGLSGTVVNITNNWVCVSGRHGIASGPGGYFRYRTATSYNSTFNAAQDQLHVMPQTRFGARYAVWFLGKSATQTATLASQITWTTNGSTVVLTFPGPSNTVQTITASISAGNGTWSTDASGNWSDTSKWSGGNLADGAGFTADFSTLNITADRTVTLDSPRTIGTLIFGDTSGAQNWFLNSSGGNALTLSAGTPTIAVLQNTATISASLAGTGGFTKSSAGTLVLAGSNSLSGTLNLDTASTSAFDGAVRVASSAAVSGITSFMIRNNTGVNAASTLQLDGSAGGVSIGADLTASCRANIIPTIENIAGSNIFSGNIFMQVGGSNLVFQSDAGTLVLGGTMQYIGSFTSARSYNFFGAGDTVVSGPILSAANGAVLSVGKYGSGNLTLSGANTYTGTTIVNAGRLNVNGSLGSGAVTVMSGGSLGGNGELGGVTTVQSGATLSPGGSVGTLTINNDVTLAAGSTTFMELNKSALTNDQLQVGGVLTCGGNLVVTNLSGALTVGDVFPLFDATGFSGSFASLTLPPLGVGLVWDSNHVALDGVLAVALGMVNPRFNQSSLIGTNLILAGAGGAANAGYSVVSSTNLALPSVSWTVTGVGTFDGTGAFRWTNGIAPGSPPRFFRVRIP